MRRPKLGAADGKGGRIGNDAALSMFGRGLWPGGTYRRRTKARFQVIVAGGRHA
jgi:hypothetical protein